MTATPDLGTPAAASLVSVPASIPAPIPPQQQPSTAEDAFDSAAFRAVFRRHAAGVAVVTAAGTRPAGFTATSLTSVSADPPLLSFGISSSGSAWPTVAEATHVGVHILGEHQEEVAATFARSGADRFAPPTAWEPGPYGVPLLEDVQGWLVARVLARIPAGDHRIIVAQAVAGAPEGEAARPLLYHHGRYNALRH
ncbi:flavin reductase family protein [Actinacidiphila sp. bgisy167]|uniref:flavin reductase family protein n=1 Tax=Actinacidiphila sp. bgisy167 TaxID=3413797 RepID=UPI003D718FF1